MKKVLLLGFVLLLASCASQQRAIAIRNGEVITTYDDMTGVKKTEVNLIREKSFIEAFVYTPTASFVLRIAENGTSTNYYICFNLEARSWWFVDTLLIKVGDNEPIYLKAVLKDRDVGSGGSVQEWVVFKASLEMFQIAAVTPNIRWRVIGSKNSKDYEITTEDQTRIKRLLAAF